MQQSAPFKIRCRDSKLEILSADGKRWDPLSAESEARFFVKGEETFRFEFIRDESGNIAALRLEIQGFQFPAATKVEMR